VLAPSAQTPVADPDRWPPQLSRMGMSGSPEDRGLRLPRDAHSAVVRITRGDPFPSASGRRVYRSMRSDDLIDEATYTLGAAALGIGPPVYALVRWPFDVVDGQQRWGLLIVMQRADSDLAQYAQSLAQPSAAETAEVTAAGLVELCFHVAWMGGIDFDIKPGNLLVQMGKQVFQKIDWDANMYRVPAPDVANLKTRFFLNLLLLAVQIRAYSPPPFARAAAVVLQHVLMPLWAQAASAPAEFGPGAEVLRNARVASEAAAGSFNERTLARISREQGEAQRLQRQLSMMIYEYVFKSTNSGVRSWRWKTLPSFTGGMPRLVPQLLEFALYHSATQAVPAAWQPLLQQP
jgi:hypothetical protein